MKKSVYFFVVFFMVSGMAFNSGARTRYSSDMDMKFDSATRQLSIFIPHQVNNPRYQYIPHVTVYLNNDQKIVQYLTRQDNDKGLSLVYKIPEAGAGDTISVTATSNMTRTVYRKKLGIE